MSYAKKPEIARIISQALQEDAASRDITTKKVISAGLKITARIIAQESGIACGIDIAREIFRSVDKKIEFSGLVKDGDRVKKGKVLLEVTGPAYGILSCERVVLNFLSFLSGISTHTHGFVKAVRPYKIKILDTRKTLPGLRVLEKYAVCIGGGYNHRQKLDEMVLIKDNHLSCIRCHVSGIRLKDIIEAARKKIPRSMKIEIEVSNLPEFKDALAGAPDIIMLDNMRPQDVKKAVRSRKGGLPKLEASGNITLQNIRAYASTGVDFISLGTLTKDIQSLDLSLEVKNLGG